MSEFSGVSTRGHSSGDTRRVKWVGKANTITNRDPARARNSLSLVGKLFANRLQEPC